MTSPAYVTKRFSSVERAVARLLDHPEIVVAYHAAGRLSGDGQAVAAVFQRSLRAGGVPCKTSLVSDGQLAGLAAPTLFVWGGDEPFGDAQAAERAAALMPNARVRVVPGGWHHPWLADSARVGAMVRDFLAASRMTLRHH